MVDIIDQMRLGVKTKFPVRLRSFEITLRPLTIAETIQNSVETQEELQNKSANHRNAITEHVIFSIKTLCLASTSSPGRGDPKLTTDTLQCLTPDELHFMFKEYCAGCDRINPSLERLSDARLKELVDMAKKNDSVLIELSFSELVNLCRVLLPT
jgi:hypothetical protein